MATPNIDTFQTQLTRLESIVQQGERFTDPTTRSHVRDLVQGILELHSSALARLLDHVTAAGPVGVGILAACVEDEAVNGLLLLHGLHPKDVQQRVQVALQRLQPILDSHGASIELLSVDETGVRVRLALARECCSTPWSLRQTVEEAIYSFAPDVNDVGIEGLEDAAIEGRYALPVL